MIDKKIASPSLPHFSRCANISHLAINTLRLLLQSPGQISPAPYRFCLEQFPGWGRTLVKKERGELAPGCVCFHHHKCLNKTLPDSEKERERYRDTLLCSAPFPRMYLSFSRFRSVCVRCLLITKLQKNLTLLASCLDPSRFEKPKSFWRRPQKNNKTEKQSEANANTT